MHSSAMKFGRMFFENYLQGKEKNRLLEIGSFDVNGSLRDALGSIDAEYIGVDFAEGKNVDVVLDDPYRLPFEDCSFDTIVSSSCFEHSEFFWLSWLEMLRLVKPGGKIYINVPFNGYIHRYPVDCWRFYPDAGLALQNWGRVNDYSVVMLESFVAKQYSLEDEGRWNDFIAVFSKSDSYDETSSRISTSIPNDIEHLILNGEKCGDDFSLPQDFVINNNLVEKIKATEEKNIDLASELTSLKLKNEDIKSRFFNVNSESDSIKSELSTLKLENDKIKSELFSLHEDNKKACSELINIKRKKAYKILNLLRIFK